MKHFIYTYSESKPPRDGSGIKKTIHVYQITRNSPTYLGTFTDTFTSPEQMLLEFLEARTTPKLPRKWFERGPGGGYKTRVWNACELGWYRATQV